MHAYTIKEQSAEVFQKQTANAEISETFKWVIIQIIEHENNLFIGYFCICVT